MSYIGTTEIGKMFLGDVEIDKAYLGNELVFSGDTPLPYTPLSYIQTDGVAYIDTNNSGITPRSVELNVVPVLPASGNTYIMGCRKDTGNTRLTFLLVNANGRAGYAYLGNTYNSTSNAISCSSSAQDKTMMLVRCSLASGKQYFGVKQSGQSSYTTKQTTVNGSITSNNYSIGIFAINNHGTFGVSAAGTRIEHAKIWENDDFTGLLFDGVACLYNGEYGIWDKVTNAFFGNSAASGAFTGA